MGSKGFNANLLVPLSGQIDQLTLSSFTKKGGGGRKGLPMLKGDTKSFEIFTRQLINFAVF